MIIDFVVKYPVLSIEILLVITINGAIIYRRFNQKKTYILKDFKHED